MLKTPSELRKSSRGAQKSTERVKPPVLDCLCSGTGSTSPFLDLICLVWGRELVSVLGRGVKEPGKEAASVQSPRSNVRRGQVGVLVAGRGGRGERDGPRF